MTTYDFEVTDASLSRTELIYSVKWFYFTLGRYLLPTLVFFAEINLVRRDIRLKIFITQNSIKWLSLERINTHSRLECRSKEIESIKLKNHATSGKIDWNQLATQSGF